MILKIFLLILIIISGFALGYLYRRNKMLRKKYDNITEYFGDVNSIMDSVRYGNLSVRAGKYTQKEMKKLTDSINRMIETLNDREKMIVEYQTELTKKNNFLSALLNSLSDGIIVFDENYKIIDANRNIKNWINTSKIMNHKVEEFIISPEEKDIIDLDNDEIFIKDNKDLYFKGRTGQLNTKDHDGKYILVVSNYTDQKEIESLKEDFVATLTHDLKVPIIAEANMLEFFLKEKFGELTKNQKEALNTMNASNKELLELVQTVLDTYKVKEGEIDLKLEKVSVSTLLNEIIEEMTPIAQKSNNKINLNVKKDFNINADYLQFKRIIKNLISNAISYGKPNTAIEIYAKTKNDRAYISVKDYGKGIPKEDIEKIFNKYFSAHKKFRKIGTGLGLYLSKKLVTAHGGELSVASKEDEWTEFIIELPINS